MRSEFFFLADKYSRPARRSEERGRQYSDVSDEEYE